MNQNKHKSAIIQTAKKRKVRRPGSRKQLKIIVLVLFVLVTVIVVAYFVFSPKEQIYNLNSYTSQTVQKSSIQDTLEIPGTVDVRYKTNVLAAETGILQSVRFTEGDWVEANQVVAVIKAQDLIDNLELLKRQLKIQKRNYEKFLLQHEQALLIATQQQKELEAAITQAEESLTDTEQNYNLDFATLDELEDAKEQLSNAKIELENFKAEQVIILKLYELDKLDNEDDLQIIQDDINRLEMQLANTMVRTPIKGQVVTIIDDLAIGSPIQESAFLMEIADTEQPLIQAVIEEQYVGLISEGQPVLVSIAGSTRPGSIEKIGLSAQVPDDGGTPVVALEVAIEAGDIQIIPGSTAVIELVLAEIEDALVLPRGPFLTSGNRCYLYRIIGNQAQKIDITVGIVTETLVQILSGVSPGDEIITSSYQNFIDYETINIALTWPTSQH